MPKSRVSVPAPGINLEIVNTLSTVERNRYIVSVPVLGINLEMDGLQEFISFLYKEFPSPYWGVI